MTSDILESGRFAELDEDQSGDLTLNEVFNYLINHPMPGQTNVWETTVQLFTKADKDGSGSVRIFASKS